MHRRHLIAGIHVLQIAEKSYLLMKFSLSMLGMLCLVLLSCDQQPPIPATTQPIFRQFLDQEFAGNQNPPWSSEKTIAEIPSGGFYSAIDFLPLQYEPFSQEGLQYRNLSLSRYDLDANLMWSKPIATGGFHHLRNIRTLENGNAIISGEQVDGAGLVARYTPWAAVVNPNGEIVWKKTLTSFRGIIRGFAEGDNSELYFLLDTDFNNDFKQYVLRTSATGDSLHLKELGYVPVNGFRSFEGALYAPGSGLVLYGDYLTKFSPDLSTEEWSILDKSQSIDQIVEYTDGYYENGQLVMLGKQTTNQVLSDVVIKSFSVAGNPQPLVQYDRFDEDEPVSFDKREAGGWVILMERQTADDFGTRRKLFAIGLDPSGDQLFSREFNDGSTEINWARGILSLQGEVLVVKSTFIENGYPWKLRVFQIENLD